MKEYAALIRVALVIALLVVVALMGRSCGKASDADELARKDRALLIAAQKLRDAATALRQVDENTKREVEAAADRAREADFAKERALIAAEDLRRALKRAELDVEEAKRDPLCRAELEKPVCAALH